MKTVVSAPSALAGGLVVLLAVIYLPGVGHGFVKDDFVWILTSRVAGIAEVPSLFARTTGFYRPVVAASFAANDAISGMSARTYGLTNFAFLLLCCAAIAACARALGLSRPASAVAAAIWSLNFHGINMAVLWISGRTALLATLFSVAAAYAMLSGRTVLAAAACALALLSKEEAIVLPIVLVMWSGWTAGPDAAARGRTIRLAAMLAIVWAAYGWLRVDSGAFTPATAPAFYRPTWLAVPRNVVEYADRSLTWPVLAVMPVFVAAGLNAPLTDLERRTLALLAIWFAAAFALTIFLPVRSSLYVVLPTAGSAIAAAIVANAAWRTLPAATGRRLTALYAAAALVMVPIHWSRARRWVVPAETSSAMLTELAPYVVEAGDRRAIVIEDEPASRRSAADAFSTMLPEAIELMYGRRVDARIEPDPDPLPEPRDAPVEAIRLRAVDGHLRRVR